MPWPFLTSHSRGAVPHIPPTELPTKQNEISGSSDFPRTVDSLPSEILLDVFELLPRKDLSSLRAVNSRFGDLAARIRYKTLRWTFRSPYDTKGAYPMRYCSKHRWYDGSGAECKVWGGNRPHRKEYPGEEECGYFSSAVSKTTMGKASWPRDSLDLILLPAAARLLLRFRNDPRADFFSKAKELVITFEEGWSRCWTQNRTEYAMQRFFDQELPYILNAMPALRSVRFEQPIEREYGSCEEMKDKLKESISELCLKRTPRVPVKTVQVMPENMDDEWLLVRK